MKQVNGKHWKVALDYAEGIRSGRINANIERKQCVERFFRDLENPDYEIRPKGPEFVINIIERTLCHQQGEALDGTPMRGKPFLLQPFHIFIVYNLLGFFHAGTEIVRFHEALIFIPRKNVKTSFAAALAWALSLWYRRSGAKTYVSSAALMQSLETFNFLVYNVRHMKEDDKDGGHVHIIDNNNEHSMEANLPDGSFFIRALAANPDTQDSLNCNIAICDEIHAFKSPKQYNLFKEAMKAYTNKLMIGISTAGDDANGFLGQRLKYCRSILDGTIKDEHFLPILYELDSKDEWTNPMAWEKANPSLNRIKKLDDLISKVERAKQSPRDLTGVLVKDFNVIQTVNTAWLTYDDINNEETFELERFKGYYCVGGVDLSHVGDLTAATLLLLDRDEKRYVVQMYWLPKEHFEKRVHEEKIPYDKWYEAGLLRLCEGNQINYSDVTKWFLEMVEKYELTPAWVYYDPYSAAYWVQEMQSAGFNLVKCFQGVKTLSLPMQKLGADLQAKKINYGNNVLLKWCITNTGIKTDVNGNIQPVKAQSPKYRIDGLASLLDAYVGLTDHYQELLDAI